MKSTRFALNSNKQLVSAEDADRNELYLCLECESELILKRGKIIVAHFAHKVQSNCNGESDTHKLAKYKLKTLLDNNEVITIQSYCCICESEFITTLQCNNDQEVFVERAFEYEGRRIIPDVSICTSDVIDIALEVLHTHKQDNRPEPWYEFLAKDILDYKELLINQRDNIRCRDCISTCQGQCFQLGLDGTWTKKYSCTCKLAVCTGCDKEMPEYWLEGNYCEECVNKFTEECKGKCYVRIPGPQPAQYIKKECKGKCVLFPCTRCKVNTPEFKLRNNVCMDCYTAPECNGSCFVKIGVDPDIWKRDRDCGRDCKLIPCIHCEARTPKCFLLDKNESMCIDCHMCYYEDEIEYIPKRERNKNTYCIVCRKQGPKQKFRNCNHYSCKTCYSKMSPTNKCKFCDKYVK